MADQSNSLPVAGLAVVAAALVSGTLLAPQALDVLRPAEHDRASDLEIVKSEVDARLWEDPFSAARRADLAQIKACNEAGRFDAALLSRCASAEHEGPGTGGLKSLIETSSPALVIAALVPGNPYVGAEEWRRRVRYALLKGLSYAGYVPHDAEHIQRAVMPLAQAQAPRAARGAAPATALTLPYESLDCAPNFDYRASVQQQQCNADQHAIVIWVDESGLAPRELDALASLMSKMFPTGDLGKNKLKVFGPTTSGALRDALKQLHEAAARNEPDSDRGRGYRILARAVFFNVSATAPATYVLPKSSAPDGQRSTAERIGDFIRIQMRTIRPDCRGADADECDYVATIGDDESAAQQIAAELCARGLRVERDANAAGAAGAGQACRPGVTLRHRVVLIGEWDSLYARTLARLFDRRFSCDGQACIESYAYLAGLDGVTLASGRGTDSAAAVAPGSPEATSMALPASKPSAIEWPESRDQRDYIRWLAKELSDSETAGRGRIDAIGLIGSDVHDKLLLLEALRREFPDRNIFTTDLDSRYLHPRALPFTRNLLVASTYPLEAELGVPMRDVYQVSIFNAARLAAGDLSALKAFRASSVLPSVYVIGRTDAHELPLPAAARDGRAPASGTSPSAVQEAPGYVLLVGLVFGALVLSALLVWPGTPSMHRLIDGPSAYQGDSAASDRPGGADRGSAFVLFSALDGAALVWLFGSGIEMAMPGRLDAGALGKAIAISAALLIVFGVIVAREAKADPAARPGRDARGWQSPFFRIAVVIAAVVGPVGLLAFHHDPDPLRVLEPVYLGEGVSAWPSQALRCVAILVAVAALDRAWFDNLSAVQAIARCLGVAQSATGGARPAHRSAPAGSGWVRAALLHSWLFMWSYEAKGGGSFTELWKDYAEYGRTRAHAIRIALAVFMFGLVAWAIQTWIDEQGFASALVRGSEHRLLMQSTIVIAGLGLIFCLVTVIDATLLAGNFVWHLNGSRTVYPREVLQRFARSLGRAGDASEWVRPIRGNPANRGDGAPSRGHSLLDNWIDVQVVAKLTEKTGSLLLAPFVVLALLLVARSSVFDNWAVTRGLAVVMGGYALLLLAAAVRVKTLAEQTRRWALESMNADLRWLCGAGDGWSALAEQFRRMIDEVKDNRTGAFAPLFNQPLVHAMLLPLGGIGGSQLLDYFLLAR